MFSNFSKLDPDAIIDDCYHLLNKSESSLVLEVINTEDKGFIQWEHYPDSDVYDEDSHAQYYYHAHAPEDGRGWEEHGHFHLFLRRKGIPEHLQPIAGQDNENIICHLVAISMNAYGQPICLFTTNRWVTGETWFDADAVCEMLDHFIIDQSWPSLAVNLWVSAMVKKYKQEIKTLLHERDAKIKQWREQYPDRDVLEDQELEIISKHDLDINDAFSVEE